MRVSVVVGVLITTLGSAAAKPGAILIPPAEVDIGAATPLGDVDVGSSFEIRAGMHWASLYWKPTPLDIGIGYLGSFAAITPTALTVQRTTTDEPDERLALHGLYFSAAYAIENHRHWRTWLGARVEGLIGNYNGKTVSATGIALRIATEVYTAGAKGASDSRVAGFFAGALAIGVYVEGLRRTLPAELGPNGFGAGLTMRVPFIAAIGS